MAMWYDTLVDGSVSLSRSSASSAVRSSSRKSELPSLRLTSASSEKIR